MITFRCDADILEALDNLGRERYHVKTLHGYDRPKILMDILRLNIEALSDGSIVLPGTVKVRQSASDNLEERITKITKASGAIEQIKVEVKADLRAELGELTATRDGNHESRAAELKAAHSQLADPEKELLQLHERNGDLRLEVQSLTEQLATVSGDSEELAQLQQELRDKMADVHA